MFKDKTIAVFGLARTGLATINWLKDKCKTIIAIDSNPNNQRDALALGATVFPEDDLPWDTIDYLIQSPGIPLNHPITITAKKNNVVICGDIDIFRWYYPKATMIGITGTNGKSTTTALITHILASAGIPAAMGGNIGVPILSLPELPAHGIYVIELSSYQLELSHSLNLDYAAILNLTPDHLDRHETFDNYLHAKSKILNHEDDFPHVFISIDDIPLQALYGTIKENHPDFVTALSCAHPADYMIYNNFLYDSKTNTKIAQLPLSNRLLGQHNYQNCLMAYGICEKLGISSDQIIQGILTFPGLPHRQEWIRTLNGIVFVNDSKATNADATARALETYKNIYWIAGGLPKEDGIDSLSTYFPKIKKIFLIGEAQESFSKTIQNAVPTQCCGDVHTAIQSAYEEASNDSEDTPVILFSPACASFDQFKDFEHRGNVFREIVNKL